MSRQGGEGTASRYSPACDPLLAYKKSDLVARLRKEQKHQMELETVDPSLLVGFDPALYLDWVLEGDEGAEGVELTRGVYGYFDRHPLAKLRLTGVAEYLSYIGWFECVKSNLHARCSHSLQQASLFGYTYSYIEYL